ncbi:acetyltransferase [Campylobacter gastrosuis]|uniref:Acetyltransferase n=1 Tax=Campylobacter gastrosuis TaxID=2974576 RepID=A0ABT7HRA9_9BACT|nr:acetyltransferase [Campylobacter gastrosuis]MDL0089444.1 acetyltransferase [Campylobacter gastrosuis]
MGYENFRVKDVSVLRVIENAKKFGVDSLVNEAVLNSLFGVKYDLSDDFRQNVAEIFIKLIKIEEDIQLSR